MKITGSLVNLSAQHSLQETTQQSERLLVWKGARPTIGLNKTGSHLLLNPIGAAASHLSLSEKAREQLRQLRQDTATKEVLGADSKESDLLTDKDRLKVALVEKLLQMVTGKKIKINVLELPKVKDNGQPFSTTINTPLSSQPVQLQIGRPTAGWGLEYDASYYHAESETMNFQAQGVVNTADGRQIDFSVALNMSRSFVEQNNISIRAGDALMKDPLVINFDASAAALTETKFQFDLDSDGRSDNISFVQPGSGFIALDKNGNGAIDNGSELFGAQSGNGFADLAAYDSDGNGWIDESDPVFDKLRIWTKDASGKDQLFALGEKGVGAIYLGNVASDFALKSLATNESQGQVRSTGVFLKENGSVGTMQQVDLAI